MDGSLALAQLGSEAETMEISCLWKCYQVHIQLPFLILGLFCPEGYLAQWAGFTHINNQQNDVQTCLQANLIEAAIEVPSYRNWVELTKLTSTTSISVVIALLTNSPRVYLNVNSEDGKTKILPEHSLVK